MILFGVLIINIYSCKNELDDPKDVLNDFIKITRGPHEYKAYDYLCKEDKKAITQSEFCRKYTPRYHLSFQKYSISEISRMKETASYLVEFEFTSINGEKHLGEECFYLVKEDNQWKVKLPR